MNPTLNKALAAAGAGAVGVIIGWGANALTLGGRVAAIESAQARIESMVYQLLQRPPAAARPLSLVPAPLELPASR